MTNSMGKSNMIYLTSFDDRMDYEIGNVTGCEGAERSLANSNSLRIYL